MLVKMQQEAPIAYGQSRFLQICVNKREILQEMCLRTNEEVALILGVPTHF